MSDADAMTTDADAIEGLEALVDRDVSVDEALALVARLPRSLDERQAGRLYRAFRAWTWRALDGRRRDEDLREWAELIRRARVRIKGSPERQRQLETLAELIAESLAVAVRLPIEEVLAKRHAPETLLALHAADGGQMSKQRLMRALGVEQSNLWRVMKLLQPTGLVESERHGRETLYRLSRAGLAEAERIRSASALERRTAELVALSDAPAPDGAEEPVGVDLTALEDELRPFSDGADDDFRRLFAKFAGHDAGDFRLVFLDEKTAIPMFSMPPPTRTVVANENEPVRSNRSTARRFAHA